jgi:GTPase SAR1 family protein
MPLPLIPLIIAGISALFGIGLSVAFWDEITIFFKGKHVTIFGAIETGKTTLHKYLREGEIVTEHKATKRKTTVEKNRFKLKELELLIKEGTDISGQQDFIKDWKEIFKNSDICFYMFDTSKVYNNDKDHIEKIYFHLTHIDKWKKEFKINPYLIMIGCFADKIPEYHTLNKSNVQLFEQKIREKIKPAFLQASISPSDIFIGSLLNKTNIETLMSEVLIRISKK